MATPHVSGHSVPVVVMTCGVAGSGKTTFAQQLELDGYVRLSIDEEMWSRFGRYGIDYDAAGYPEFQAAAEETVRMRLIDSIERGHDVVLDLSFARRADRDEYKRLIEAAGARWRLVYLSVSHDELRTRLKARSSRFDANAAFTVDEDLLSTYLGHFEVPEAEGEESVRSRDVQLMRAPMLIYDDRMTDHDHAATRREVADALLAALERRHEVLDAIVESDDRPAAIEAIASLLSTSRLGGEAVMGMSFDQLTKDARRKNAAELEDMNKQLSFTLVERPASAGEGLSLVPFSGDTDRDIFAARIDDIGSSGDGSGGAVGSLDDEIASALSRFEAEDAMWFVVVEGSQQVGMVFGEMVDGEVDVRVWVHPEHRRMGYGTAALRKSRAEMVAYFPGVPLIIRAPGVGSDQPS